jgi:hypothetical protein
VYDGDVYLMACELDVTMQVIKDYQCLALPRIVSDLDA